MLFRRTYKCDTTCTCVFQQFFRISISTVCTIDRSQPSQNLTVVRSGSRSRAYHCICVTTDLIYTVYLILIRSYEMRLPFHEFPLSITTRACLSLSLPSTARQVPFIIAHFRSRCHRFRLRRHQLPEWQCNHSIFNIKLIQISC